MQSILKQKILSICENLHFKTNKEENVYCHGIKNLINCADEYQLMTLECSETKKVIKLKYFSHKALNKVHNIKRHDYASFSFHSITLEQYLW
ncbi:CLUMA_CG010223, isoform A [Clunio marinus]|uniref:CLUMA_CG010223, isoform A n=1 Tax=Clunio marinus TaxID=568069 RepID=A0A1J1IA88_9DIPT|nr:CLUMA_CG010223, isoform A [Clunio marinus]